MQAENPLPNIATMPLAPVQRAFAPRLSHQGMSQALTAYLLDALNILTALFMADLLVSALDIASGLSWTTGLLILIGWSLGSVLGGLYADSPMRLHPRVLLVSASLSALMVFSGLYLTAMNLPREFMMASFGLHLLLIVGWRGLAVTINTLTAGRHQSVQKRVLIVGANDFSRQVLETLKQVSNSHTEIFGILDDEQRGEFAGETVVGRLADAAAMVRDYGIDEVLVALPGEDTKSLNAIALMLQDLPVKVCVLPNFLGLSLYRPTLGQIGGLPMIELSAPALSTSQRLMKRAFDIAVSGTLLLLASPVMAIIAIAIKLDSEGPVLFKQERVGQHGKPFKMYKFRSMVQNAEALQAEVNTTDAQGNTIHKRRNDPRVTRVGRIIRKTSLDELPQLINVLNGSMSLVGPRPELPWLVEEAYEPWMYQRFAVPQGITGWWQVNGRADKPMHLNGEQDVYYVQNYSFWLDIQILLRTVPALLKGKGAF